MDFEFMAGSMGGAVGEKFARACERAAERGVPLVSVTASGGARMQEGILSLMQLPKTVCAVDAMRESRAAFVSILAHPTTGGVLASFASLGDVILAEPGALMSFAGPRVVQQITREKLPGRLRRGRVEPSASATSTRSSRAPSCGRTSGRAARALRRWQPSVAPARRSSSGCATASRGCSRCRFCAASACPARWRS